MKLSLVLGILALVAASSAQGPGTAKPGATPNGTAPVVVAPAAPASNTGAVSPDEITRMQREQAIKRAAQKKKWDMMREEEISGTNVRLKDIGHFRGAWTNQLSGYGIVTGLDGTGDSSKFATTSRNFTNALKKAGLDVDVNGLNSKNIALVLITAELPPYSVPGQMIDVTVSTVGDAKSLRGGVLLQSPLTYNAGAKIFATSQGSISVGGFAIEAGGNSQSKGFVTVGRIPGGAIVQESVPTATVFDGKMYFDLDDQDVTTSHRIEERINQLMPEFNAVAMTGRTIQITLPRGLTAISAEARLAEVNVSTDVQAKVVVNERTGTIVIGGNVRLGPCAFAKGSLSVKVEEDITVSQPGAFSNGTTQVISNKKLDATEDTTPIALMRPNTTVADLAAILQSLKLKASDIIDILQSLRSQGALKAKVVIE